MKKILIITLVAMLGLLTACGNSEEESSSVAQNQTIESSSQTQSESGKETESTKETMSQQESSSVEETTQKPTETEKQTEKPTVKPTQASTQKPAQAPTVAPTQPATQKPTQNNDLEALIRQKVLTHRLCKPIPMDDEYWHIYKFTEDGKVYKGGYYSNGNIDIENIQYLYYGDYNISNNKLIIDTVEYTYYSDFDYFQNITEGDDPVYGYTVWRNNLVPYNGELNVELRHKFYNYGSQNTN